MTAPAPSTVAEGINSSRVAEAEARIRGAVEGMLSAALSPSPYIEMFERASAYIKLAAREALAEEASIRQLLSRRPPSVAETVAALNARFAGR